MKDTASGITAVERALHVPQRRQGARPRPGCARGRAGVGMTEFSAVPAYNPAMLPRHISTLLEAGLDLLLKT